MPYSPLVVGDMVVVRWSWKLYGQYSVTSFYFRVFDVPGVSVDGIDVLAVLFYGNDLAFWRPCVSEEAETYGVQLSLIRNDFQESVVYNQIENGSLSGLPLPPFVCSRLRIRNTSAPNARGGYRFIPFPTVNTLESGIDYHDGHLSNLVSLAGRYVSTRVVPVTNGFATLVPVVGGSTALNGSTANGVLVTPFPMCMRRRTVDHGDDVVPF